MGIAAGVRFWLVERSLIAALLGAVAGPGRERFERAQRSAQALLGSP